MRRAPEAPGADSVTPSEPAGEEGGEQAEPGQAGPDIDKLARDVYGILRNRLRVERERSTGQ
ncbi:MAG: hypothetical protein M5R40_19505 [Anaerolineae bacterium]|nr:hypothetical protein [Anaerolineae bacterium]